jgi:hypothetical protein
VKGDVAGFLWLDGDPAEDLELLRHPRGIYLARDWVVGSDDRPPGGGSR